MNQRVDDADAMMEYARECVERQDYPKALSFVRRAYAAAPLRQDVRDLLAVVSEHTSETDETIPESKPGGSTPRQTRRAQKEELPPRRSLLDLLRDSFAADPEEEEMEEEAQPVRVRMDRSHNDSPGPESPAPSQPAGTQEGSIADRLIRKRREKFGPRTKTDSPEKENEYWNPSPQFVAQLLAYSCILLFILTASGFSYAKFFYGNKSGTNEIAGKQPSDNPVRTSSQAVEETIKTAASYAENQRYDDAVAVLSEALQGCDSIKIQTRLRAELASVYDTRGTALLTSYDAKNACDQENDKIFQSIESYKKAAEMAPKNAKYSLHLGNAYYYGGECLGNTRAGEFYEKALGALNKSLQLDRDSIAALHRMATVCEKLEKNTDACAAWTRIVKMAPPTSNEAEDAQKHLRTLSMAK